MSKAKITLEGGTNFQTLCLHGVVGEDIKFSSTKTVLSMVAKNKPLLVQINSVGGDVRQGAQIAEMIEDHPAQTHCMIDGECSSIATIIALACDSREMSPDSFFMIHFPSAIVQGRADEVLQVGKRLQLVGQAAIESYLETTNLSEDLIIDLMNQEKKLNPEQCLALDLIDRITQPATPIETMARMEGRFMKTTQAEKLSTEPSPAMMEPEGMLQANVVHETQVHVKSDSEPVKATAETVVVSPETKTVIVTPETEVVNVMTDESATVDTGNSTKKVIESGSNDLLLERARVKGIMEIFESRPEKIAMQNTLIESGASVEMSAKKLLAALETPIKTEIMKQQDNQAKALELSMQRSFGVKVDNEVPNLSMSDIAGELVRASGITTLGKRKHELFMVAQKTTDFPIMLADSCSRGVLAAFEEEPAEYLDFVDTGTVPDFRESSRGGLSDYDLVEIPEATEYPTAALTELGGPGGIKARKFGTTIHITWEALLNDDLGEFNRAIRGAGRASRAIESQVVYEALTGAVLAPENIAANAGAPSDDNISELYTQATTHATVQMPANIIVPAKYFLSAARILNSSVQMGATNSAENALKGLMDLVSARRLAGNAWYVSSKGAVELVRLEGQETPYTEELGDHKSNVDDTIRYKIRHVAGSSVVDKTRLFKNLGA